MTDKNDKGRFGGDCSLCPRYLDCANLETAQKIIQAKLPNVRDETLKHRYESMVQILNDLQLSFPAHDAKCTLSDLPDLSRELVEEAIQMVSDMEDSVKGQSNKVS